MEYSPASSQLDAALSRELRRGERVLWNGRPIGRVDRGKFAIYLFAIPWTAFSIFWTAGASIPFFSGVGQNDWAWALILFPLFGIPFVATGIGMLSVPFLPLFLSSKTLFAVTDQRVIKLTLKRQLQSETVPADRVGLIKRTENSDGSGSLRITTGVGRDSDGDKSIETFEIGEVSDVLQVEARIQEMSRLAARRTAPATLG